jgi:PHP family Zn ribbon phosphoesterase
MTDQEVVPVGVGVSNAVRGDLTIGRIKGLLLVGTTDCYEYTQTENIKHFDDCILSECTV